MSYNGPKMPDVPPYMQVPDSEPHRHSTDMSMYEFAWNFKLWLKGLMLLALFPVVIAWKVFVDFPIAWAKEFESEREE